MSGLLELADRCAAATGPDREIDAAIDRLMHNRPQDGDYDQDEGGFWQVKDGSGLLVRSDGFARDSFYASEYTTSLDAAVTLVPKGWWWSAGKCSVSCDATVGPDVAHCDKATLIEFDAGISCDLPNPSTPALALCAASLRALASLQARGDQV